MSYMNISHMCYIRKNFVNQEHICLYSTSYIQTLEREKSLYYKKMIRLGIPYLHNMIDLFKMSILIEFNKKKKKNIVSF